MFSRDDGKVRRVVLMDSWDKEHTVMETRELAAEAGFNATDQAMISTAASELAMNILRYAGQGEFFVRIVREPGRQGIELLAFDDGPGIDDVEKAMEDHYTTQKGSLGLGLPSVRRIMDEFEIDSSPGRGTRIIARKWRNRDQY